MEKAKLIELALGLAAFAAIFVGGFLFARQSDRAPHPKPNHR
ncbi:MAG: hypothetical protein U0176_12215 [Bacteroidia bacterium]